MPNDTTRVLIVDDDVNNLDLLERILRKRYIVIRAEHGVAALEAIRSEMPDVIITDQRMPGMSGTQLLTKSLEIHPKAVKIILSAYTDTADILSAINVCRINHYLVKPLDAEKLVTVIETALQLVPESERYGI